MMANKAGQSPGAGWSCLQWARSGKAQQHSHVGGNQERRERAVVDAVRKGPNPMWCEVNSVAFAGFKGERHQNVGRDRHLCAGPKQEQMLVEVEESSPKPSDFVKDGVT